MNIKMKILNIYFLSIFWIISIDAIQHQVTQIPFGKAKKDSKILNINFLPNPYLYQRSFSNNPSISSSTPKLMQLKQNSVKNGKLNNKEILNKLGLSEIFIPPSHSRKRLAVESRHHAHPDDSKIFVVKLPPKPHYYAHNKLKESKNSIQAPKKLSIDIQSNGKWGPIYHWNLPVIKKIMTNSRKNNDRLLDIKNIPTWSNHWENEAMEKSSYGNFRSVDSKKSTKKSIPTYFAPNDFHHYNHQQAKIQKNFPGNGKLKSLYVIKKNGKKPSYYKNLTS